MLDQININISLQSDSMSNKQNQGIHANNQDFKNFDQVNKTQNYQLSESSDESFDDEFQIKTVDMSAALSGDKGAFACFSDELGKAMEEIGFVIITGHGIDTDLYQQAEQKIMQFFETISEDKRKPYLAKRQGSVNQGYFPIKQTSQIHPDLVEGWVFCRRAFNMDSTVNYEEQNFWPETGYEPFFRQLCQAHENLILPIMQAILNYLDAPKNLYDKKLKIANFGFRLNYYPALQQEDLESGAGRMLGHEDVDLFTFLPSQDLEGLQVLNRKNMKWIRLNPPKGSIVINTGDYMQRISNDRLPSTTHRVSVPAQKTAYQKPRISFPMAIYVREEEILECLPNCGEAKYPPITAIEFHTKTTSKYYGKEYAVNKEQS